MRDRGELVAIVSVWHFCGARNADKVDNLNKRILRFILQDYSSPYDILLSKVNMKSLFIRRLQNFMITSHNIRVCSLRIIQVI